MCFMLTGDQFHAPVWLGLSQDVQTALSRDQITDILWAAESYMFKNSIKYNYLLYTHPNTFLICTNAFWDFTTWGSNWAKFVIANPKQNICTMWRVAVMFRGNVQAMFEFRVGFSIGELPEVFQTMVVGPAIFDKLPEYFKHRKCTLGLIESQLCKTLNYKCLYNILTRFE